MVSYAVPEISVLKFQDTMPNVPRPDTLRSELEVLSSLLSNEKLSKFHPTIQMRLEQPIVIEKKRLPSKLIFNSSSDNGVNNKLMIWYHRPETCLTLLYIG